MNGHVETGISQAAHGASTFQRDCECNQATNFVPDCPHGNRPLHNTCSSCTRDCRSALSCPRPRTPFWQSSADCVPLFHAPPRLPQCVHSETICHTPLTSFMVVIGSAVVVVTGSAVVVVPTVGVAVTSAS